ncbi:PqqD family protein [Sphingomonas sp. MMS24-J45]|uniref:PqqD family protein n=1 Tax=Sphingomonas sp. MMS24-J45 TaxID=3238806 RepID=UPI00384D8B62
MDMFRANRDLPPVNPDTRYHRKAELIDATVKKAILALNVDTGESYSLAGPSGRVWRLLDTPSSATEIATILTTEYVIDLEPCTAQVCAFLALLLKEDIIAATDRDG